MTNYKPIRPKRTNIIGNFWIPNLNSGEDPVEFFSSFIYQDLDLYGTLFVLRADGYDASKNEWIVLSKLVHSKEWKFNLTGDCQEDITD